MACDNKNVKSLHLIFIAKHENVFQYTCTHIAIACTTHTLLFFMQIRNSKAQHLQIHTFLHSISITDKAAHQINRRLFSVFFFFFLDPPRAITPHARMHAYPFWISSRWTGIGVRHGGMKRVRGTAGRARP